MSVSPHPPYPPVAELIPHDAPMILVDELIAWTPTHAQVRAKVRRGGPFVVDGRVSGTILLEYMAQAVAVADGMTGHVLGRSDIGLLLGSRELVLEVDHVDVGDELDMCVEQQFADGRVANYTCQAFLRGSPSDAPDEASSLLASASISVMVAPPEELRRR